MSNLAEMIQEMQRQALDFEVLAIDEDTNQLGPGEKFSQARVIDECVIHDIYLREQVQMVAPQIQHWARLAARAQRVYEMVDRQYRVWRERVTLEAYQEPDPKPRDWKKPTGKEVEAAYRVHPQYEVWQQRIERAREAWNACEANAKGFQAKQRMLERSVRRSQIDGAPTLDV